MRFGVHISTAGNLVGTPARAAEMGATALQIFTGSPRTWKQANYDDKTAESFKAELKRLDMPCYTHMMYLTAYASDNPELRRKSVDVAKLTLETAHQVGISGVVTHMGSHKGKGVEGVVNELRDSLTEVLTAGGDVPLLLECSAGSGGNIGRSLEELALILEALDNHPRVGFCLDTAHLFGAGYDIRTSEGWEAVLDEFDERIGLDRLHLLHLNDSKVELGSFKDRHDNIGEGFIGDSGFTAIVNSKRAQNIPGVMEVPGIDGKGPDKPNLDKLKSLVA